MSAGRGDQLALHPATRDPVLPVPRSPAAGEHLQAVPVPGGRGREFDRWRISGARAPVLTEWGPQACTWTPGLCGVCSGGPCHTDHDPDHQHPDDEHDPDDQHETDEGDRERETEDEEFGS